MPQISQNAVRQGHQPLALRNLPAHRRRMIRALMVDDDVGAVELCLQELKKAQFAISADVVNSRADFTERLRQESYDVVMAASSMNGWTGQEALSLLKKCTRKFPSSW